MRTREKARIVKMFLAGHTVEQIAFGHVQGLPDGGMHLRRMAVESVLREALRKRRKRS